MSKICQDGSLCHLEYDIHYYYIDTSVLLENTSLVKFIRNHIQDSSGIFSISSPVRISMISLISLKVFGNLQVSLENLKNVRQCSRDLWTSFGESSEIFGKWLEIFGKTSKMLSSWQK